MLKNKLALTMILALAPMLGFKAGSVAAACFTGCTGAPLHKTCVVGGAGAGREFCTVPDGSHCEFSGNTCVG